MTKAQLTKIAKDFTKLGKGDKVVDVNVDNEVLYGEHLVFVLVVTKFHTVLKYTLWINAITGDVNEDSVDLKVLD